MAVRAASGARRRPGRGTAAVGRGGGAESGVDKGESFQEVFQAALKELLNYKTVCGQRPKYGVPYTKASYPPGMRMLD